MTNPRRTIARRQRRAKAVKRKAIAISNKASIYVVREGEKVGMVQSMGVDADILSARRVLMYGAYLSPMEHLEIHYHKTGKLDTYSVRVPFPPPIGLCMGNNQCVYENIYFERIHEYRPIA
jgi:hypothetical protein